MKRIDKARERLRSLDLSGAMELLEGANFKVDYSLELYETDKGEPGATARAISNLAHGSLSTVSSDAKWAWLNRADLAKGLAAGRPYAMFDFFLMTALVYAKANIHPRLASLVGQARKYFRDASALKVLELMAESNGTFTARPSHAHPRHDNFLLTLWRGDAKASQKHVVTYYDRKAEETAGALILESPPAKGNKSTYSLYFYDLDAQPLLISEYASEPSEQELLAFASRFNPNPGKKGYTIMRGEFEALVALRQGITPLAARWAEYAGTQLVRENVKKALQARRAWNWNYLGTYKAGPRDRSPYDVAIYFNGDQPKSAKDLEGHRGALEHIHFAVFSRQPKPYASSPQRSLYVGSYALASDEPVPGERLFFLKRVVAGQSHVVKSYDSLPSFDSVLETLVNVLEEPPPG